MHKNSKILVIDDNEEILYAIELLLSRQFENIKTEKSPKIIPSLLTHEMFDVIILDMNFDAGISSGNEGIYWMNEILKMDSQAIIVFITAYGDLELAVKAMREGGTDFIQKPWDDNKFIQTIENAYQLRKKNQEISKLKFKQEVLEENISMQFPEIIGESPAMKEIFKTIDKVAKTDANVLILGENGTGKELIAREIHNKSNRKKETIVNLDVSALPDSLFESELFGYVKGAFTDAKTDKPGRFELANGGSLFLDEIGNLSLTAQSKLLTVLQNKEISRLGAIYKIPVDIRLICATNKPLYEMIKTGEYREDLLYRINTIQLELPPLRNRIEDIPLLAEHFKEKFSTKYEKPDLVITDQALNKLCAYHWPGNIRELEHLVEKAIIMTENNILDDIDFQFTSGQKAFVQGESLDLSENEKRVIIRALAKHKGNYTNAAKEMGITRKTLYNKLKKYGLE